MTTTEQIQQLNNAVTALQTQVASISNQLSTETNKLNLHLVDSDSDIAQLNAKTNLLTNADSDIHQELHDVEVVVNDNVSRLDNLDLLTTEQGDDITQLKAADEDFQTQIEDMDVEHHEELHKLATAINEHSTRINGLEIFKAETPEHVVMSESEYNQMPEHDYDTFYFVYEEE
jgi:chromosome segregation ATPase